MTAMDFPLNPNDGDTHDNYVYDATHGVWNQNPQQLAARFIASDTAPTSPSTGDAWFDTETGKTYVYHDSSWVESGNPVIGYVDPYDQDSTSTGYFSLPSGTTAQRPVTPSNGDIRFNTTLGEPEYYSEAESDWFLFRERAGGTFNVEYLVVAGGGGGGGGLSDGSSGIGGGGGGAGGYRANIDGEFSGRNSTKESTLELEFGLLYGVTVGGGGAGGIGATDEGGVGENSTFGSIISQGGGGGGSRQATTNERNGGAGGGAAADSGSGTSGGSGTTAQGFDGGDAPIQGGTSRSSAGGGGAGSVGQDQQAGQVGGSGGSGLDSSISGSSIARAGGGGGGAGASNVGGSATAGGGAGGNTNFDGSPGDVNTGGGGGGAAGSTTGNKNGGLGGSGIVVIKYPADVTMQVDPGLTELTSNDGQFKVTQFTAGTGSVTFS